MHRMLVPRLEEMRTSPAVTRVVAAHSPKAALEEVARLPPGPLAIVTDFNLKDPVNGLELLRRIRRLREDSVRVLFSGYSMEQLGDVAQAEDVHAFLEKPLLLDDLIRPLEAVITREFATGARSRSSA